MHNKVVEYDNWHQIVHGKESPTTISLADWHENAISLSPCLKQLNILEVGCGVGDFAIYLANQGAYVTSVDFSPRAIEIAKDKSKLQGVKNIN